MSRGLDALVNFAAETHVDRSIEDASPFLRTNVLGTQCLLDAAKRFKLPKFVQISTDEVYGSAPGQAAALRKKRSWIRAVRMQPVKLPLITLFRLMRIPTEYRLWFFAAPIITDPINSPKNLFP